MKKGYIKNLPYIGKLADKFLTKLKTSRSFTTSGEYWENRYHDGGNSGAGSYHVLAEYKAEIINEFVRAHEITSVIEFGCGDGNQLKYLQLKSYMGFDVSSTAIHRCKELFKSDTSKQFGLLESYDNEKAELILSLDVIFHLVEEQVYRNYLQTLFEAADDFVIIYSSNTDDHESDGIEAHVKHRKFTQWVDKNVPDFKLIEHIPNKHHYNGDGEITSHADFYIFQKDS